MRFSECSLARALMALQLFTHPTSWTTSRTLSYTPEHASLLYILYLNYIYKPYPAGEELPISEPYPAGEELPISGPYPAGEELPISGPYPVGEELPSGGLMMAWSRRGVYGFWEVQENELILLHKIISS